MHTARPMPLMLTLLLLAGCAATPRAGSPAPAPVAAVAAGAAPTPSGSAVVLAPGVTLVPGRFVPGTQPDGNTVVLHGRAGDVVIDTGRHPGHLAQVFDVLREGGNVVAIVNTHWHLDHVGGNADLRAAYPGAPVLASDAVEAALVGFLADYRAQLAALVQAPPAEATPADIDGWKAEMARIDHADALRPTRRVEATSTLTLGGRALQVGVEREAVSGGDVWVLDRATRTLVAGDLVTLPVPLLDTACAAGWKRALTRLEGLEFDRLVPGHGAPMDRAGLATYRQAFDRLLACAASTAPSAACKAQWLADAGALVPSTDAALADSLLDYYLDGVLRAPPARRDRYCTTEKHR